MADGSVTIKAILDASKVESGVSEINSSLGSISTSGMDGLESSAEQADKKVQGLGDTSKTAKKDVEGLGSTTGQSSSKLVTMGASLGTAGMAASAAGSTLTNAVTNPLITLGKEAINMSAQFEQSMNTIQVMSGASADEMQRLSDYAQQMGADTVFSSNDAATAMVNLSKAGATTDQILGGLLDSTMTLATAGDMSLADASTVCANAMNMFHLTAGDSGQAVAALAGAANASTADVSDLAQGLSQCGTVASSAGWNIQETSGALGMFAQAGINGSDAGTSLKQMLMSLENPSKQAKDLMEQYGVSLYNADGSMKNAASVAQNLQDAFGGLSNEQRNAALGTIFGSDAVRVANVMYENGAAGLQTYTDAAGDLNAANDLAAVKMGGTAGAVEAMNGSVDTAKQKLGQALAPTVQKVADVVGKLADAFTNLEPSSQMAITAVAGILAALGPILSLIGPILMGMSSIALAQAAAAAGTAAAASSTGLLGAAFGALTGPVGIVIAIIVAVVAALVYCWNTSEQFRTAVTSAIKLITDSFSQAWTTLQPILTALGNILVSFIVPAAIACANIIGSVFSGAFEAAAAIVSGAFQIIVGIVEFAIGYIETIIGVFVGLFTGDWSMASDGASMAMQGCADAIAGILTALSGTVAGILNAIVGFFGSIMQGAVDIVGSVFGTIADSIRGKMGSAGDAVADGLSAIAGFFANLKIEWPHIPLPHFSISGSFNLDPANFSVPSLGVDWYAKGGRFNSASIIGIGEAGPEAALPLNDGTYGEIADGISEKAGFGNMQDISEIVSLLKSVIEEIKKGHVIMVDDRVFARACREALNG